MKNLCDHIFDELNIYTNKSTNSNGYFKTKCSCEQQQGGKCSHVAALLYLAEAASMDIPLHLDRPCTSKLQGYS